MFSANLYPQNDDIKRNGPGPDRVQCVWGQASQRSDMTGMSGMSANTTGRACDDTSHMGAMTVVMGESMAAMANHLCMTPLRPMQPGDEERAKALVTQVKAVLEKYKDYKKALADGYTIANPNVEMPQYHFMNAANAKLADTQFDPTRPTALLYYHTGNQRYRLEGVMYTDDVDATEDRVEPAHSAQHCPLASAHQLLRGAGEQDQRVPWPHPEVRHVWLDPHCGGLQGRGRHILPDHI